MARKQSNDLLVLQILSKYSDERHYLTATDVIDLIQSEFGLNVERRTIYTTVDVLKEMGYEIETYAENNKGYLLKKRPVAKEDMDQIIQSLYMDPTVNKKQFSDIVYRLYQTQSLYTKNDTGKLYAEKSGNFFKDASSEIRMVPISDAILLPTLPANNRHKIVLENSNSMQSRVTNPVEYAGNKGFSVFNLVCKVIIAPINTLTIRVMRIDSNPCFSISLLS